MKAHLNIDLGKMESGNGLHQGWQKAGDVHRMDGGRERLSVLRNVN